MRIMNNGIKTTINGMAHDDDIELIRWMVSNLSFVNGINYNIDGQQWIDNIKATYDENIPQIKLSISLINSL